jgi:hypothetical protein
MKSDLHDLKAHLRANGKRCSLQETNKKSDYQNIRLKENERK